MANKNTNSAHSISLILHCNLPYALENKGLQPLVLISGANVNRRLVNIYFQALQEKLAYILNFNFIIGIECSNAVFKHGNAVRTGSCQYRCPRLQCLFYTQIAEALTFEFFHP